MTEPDRSTAGGGCLIAVAVLAGVVIGLALHQPTIGFLAGLALGVAGRRAAADRFDRVRLAGQWGRVYTAATVSAGVKPQRETLWSRA